MTSANKSHRGFTLIELGLVLLLMAIGLAIVLSGLRSPRDSVGAKFVAQQTAEFLRRTQLQAQKNQESLAVVIPGGKGLAQSFSVYSGAMHPVVTRVKDFSKEYPETVLFLGSYPASKAWSIGHKELPGSGFHTTGVDGSLGSAPIVEWLGDIQGGHALIFLPDGSVTSNDIPSQEGVFQIVVCQGAEVAASNPDGDRIFPSGASSSELTRVASPHTVSVSASGIIKVSKGLLNGTLVPQENAIAMTGLPQAVNPQPETTSQPRITKFLASPSAGYLQGLFGIDHIMHPKRQLTFEVLATQDNDEDLYCEVVTENSKGRVSRSGPQKMYRQPSRPPFIVETWRSKVQWAPPVDAKLKDNFIVNAVVTSSRGGMVTTAGNEAFEMKISMQDFGRIIFGAENASSGVREVYSVRADGTDLQRVTFQDQADRSQHSPAGARDGRKLAFTSINTNTSGGAIFAQNRRGGLTTKISDAGILPHMSDDTTIMVFQEYLGYGVSRPRPMVVKPDSTVWPPPVIPVFEDGDPILSATLNGLARPTVSPPIPFGPGKTPANFVPDPDNKRSRLPRRLAMIGNYGLPNPKDLAVYTCDFYDPNNSVPISNFVRQTASLDGAAVFLLHGVRVLWHPDGKKLTFNAFRNSKNSIFAIPFKDDASLEPSVNADDAVLLSGDIINCRDPYYSPDGKRLIFASNNGVIGDWDLYIVELDPADDYLSPARAPYRIGLNRYTWLTNTFKSIRGTVWTL